MKNDLDRPRFNGDLLIRKDERKLAADLYPTVLDVLDHPELRARFEEYDKPANADKQRSRRLGSLAIVLAT